MTTPAPQPAPTPPPPEVPDTSNCPHCGSALQAVTASMILETDPDPAFPQLTFPRVDLGDTAPWLCVTCQTGWWNAELTASSRAAFDLPTRSMKVDFRQAIKALVRAEHTARWKGLHP